MAGAGCCTSQSVSQGTFVTRAGKPIKANTMANSFANLPQKNNVIAEYIWIDGGETLRAKCRTIKRDKITNLNQLPEWNFDGSSCYQATTENSEVILKPAYYFPDPFRLGNNVMVICETYKWSDKTYQNLVPCNTNFRHFAKKIFDQAPAEQPWFGIEQEYTLLDEHGTFVNRPHKWPKNGYPGNQGPFYCAVGGNTTFGREVADMHYKCCLYAGIKISGTNGEVMPSQWEYQVGPSVGIDQGDHMWAARYLLMRVAELHKLSVSFEPKIFKDWNGSGAHTNFSTKKMREGSGGMKYIEDMMTKFEGMHLQHMEMYGAGNKQRLTGIHETSPYDKFSYGAGNRAASIRIPTQTLKDNGKGYIEDRRPASNVDPYVVSAMIFATTCLQADSSKEMIEHYKAWEESIPSMSIVKV